MVDLTCFFTSIFFPGVIKQKIHSYSNPKGFPEKLRKFNCKNETLSANYLIIPTKLKPS